MGTKRRATEVVQAARGRLKGALQDVINVAEDDDDVESSTPSRGRPPKRLKKEILAAPPPPPATPAHQSFIMKLFERSVDLAKYNENTSLYPICRAWMMNQPRSTSIASYKNQSEPEIVERVPQPDLLQKILSGKVVEVTELSASADIEISRVPSPLPFQKKCSKDNINLDYDLEEPSVSRQELLADLKGKWTQVRTKWMQHSKMYEEKKHGTNMSILEALYKK